MGVSQEAGTRVNYLGLGLALAPGLGERINSGWGRACARGRAIAALVGGCVLAFGIGVGHGHARALARVQGERQEGQSYLLVIGGIGGEPKYTEAFHSWGSALVKAAVERHGMARENVTWLAESPERDPRWISGKATKQAVEEALVALGGKAGASDQVFIVLIGHGSFQGTESRFNVSGPDPSAQDFARLLGGFRARVAFINTASASGEFAKLLSGENRTIVTATKSGQERNEAVFGKHFVDAYAKDAADVDKDGRISLLEAFNYARVEVEREYKADNRLLTEHAVLEDNGDRAASSEPDPEEGDGALARAMFLGAGTPVTGAPADASPAVRALYEQKRAIEQQILELRARKTAMDSTAYQAELERLLVLLAEKDQEIRRAGGGI